ncbi:MAG: peptide ABC transporter substrate-binding protein [Clostridiales bacterium]|nr:peptide ABC transporter substrate-binding protein [Clostridiales bacterium]
MLPAKRILAGVLVLVLITALTGCQAPIEELEEQPEMEENPVKGGQVVFAGTEPKTLNPLVNIERDAYHFLKLVFEGLVDYDRNLKPRPGLAKDWSISGVGNSCTFNLREGLKWHDGTPVTARDVIFTLEYLKALEDGAGLYTTNIDRVAYFEALDDYSVRVVFDQWFNGALDIMTFPVLPSHLYSSPQDLAGGEAEFQLVGTGPYKLKEYQPYKYLELELNPDWWGGEPYITEVEIQFVADEETALTSFKNGQADIAIATNPDWERYREDGKAYIKDYITNKFDFLGLNFTNPIFQDKSLRKAIQYGINRDEIVDKVYLKHAVIVDTPVPPHVWLYSEGEQSYAYDPETARDILGEAGWADRDNDGLLEKEIDGVKHDLKFTLLANSDNPKRYQAARMIRDDLVGLGISVVLEELTWEGLLERVNKKEFDAVVLGWSLANYLDFSFAFHTNQIEGGSNFFSYSDEEMDSLLQQDFWAREETRKETNANLQRYIAEELPYNSLYFKKAALLIKSRVRGEIGPREHNVFMDIEKWYIPEELQ